MRYMENRKIASNLGYVISLVVCFVKKRLYSVQVTEYLHKTMQNLCLYAFGNIAFFYNH